MSTALNVAVGASLCETLLYGIYTVLFSFSGYVLLFRRSRLNTTLGMLLAIVVMYSVSSAHWALNIAALVVSMKANSSQLQVLMNRAETLAIVYLPSVNYVLSDVIVLWRVWLICERESRLFVFPILFTIGIVVVTIISAVYDSRSLMAGRTVDAQISIYTGVASWGLTILNNLWATALIAWKAWRHRQFIHSQLKARGISATGEKVLVLLLESGALYLCIWVAYTVPFLTTSIPATIFDAIIVQIVVSSAVKPCMSIDIEPVDFQGIYPTAIIAIVCIGVAQTEFMGAHELPTIRFAEHTISTCTSTVVPESM